MWLSHGMHVDIHIMCMWLSHCMHVDINIMCLWQSHGMQVDIHILCMWQSHGMHVMCMWHCMYVTFTIIMHAYDSHMMCMYWSCAGSRAAAVATCSCQGVFDDCSETSEFVLIVMDRGISHLYVPLSVGSSQWANCSWHHSTWPALVCAGYNTLSRCHHHHQPHYHRHHIM